MSRIKGEPGPFRSPAGLSAHTPRGRAPAGCRCNPFRVPPHTVITGEMLYIIPMKRIPALCLFLTALPCLFAQYDPRISWQYIDTEYNRIIFPDYMAEEGLRAAALTEQVRPLITEGMDTPFFHVYPVILSGNDMTSNGFVTIYPRRSVWYSFNRGFGSGTTEWYDHLAVHEGRHTVQFDRLNASAGHILYLLGGESWYSLTIGMTPSWIYEGDAIRTETLYSASGRGRLGSYFELMRGLSLEETPPSYYETLLISYRNATPSAHALGYPLMNWIEENHGPLAADSLFGLMAELPLPLWGPSRAVRRVTGLTPRRAYDSMMDDLKGETERIIAAKGTLIEGERLTPVPPIYTAWSQLIPGTGGEWYGLKADLSHTSALYRYDGMGREEKLFSPSPATRIDGREGTFVWDSLRTNLTWTTRQTTDLYLKEEGKNAVRLTENGRYYHPALNEGGDRIAALEWSLERKPFLVILDRSGLILERIPFPEEITYASWPAWDEDRVVLLVQNRWGEALWRREGDSFRTLIPYTTEDMNHPAPWNGGVFFSLDRYEGEEICYWKDGVIRRVSNSPLGTGWPVADREKGRLLMIGSEGALGDSVRTLPLDSWERGPEIILNPLPPADAPGLTGFGEEKKRDYEIKDYRVLSLFNPVGWGITTLSQSDDDLEIPFTLISINPMQTLAWEAGLYYNTNENTLSYRGTAAVSLFLPLISTGFSLDERIREGRSIHDFSTSAGLSFPLGFTRGQDTFSLELSGEALYLYSWTKNDEERAAGFAEAVTLLHSRPGSYRSLQPRFEESAEISLLHTSEASPRHRLSASGHLLLPGLHPTHGSGFYAYYEENPSLMTSLVPAVRGWDYVAEKELIMARAEYVLPLFYPDLALGGLAYFPRISGELFYDSQWGGKGFEESKRSAGFELLADTFFLSLPLQVRSGFRFSWLIEEEKPSFQFVIKGFSVEN